jgi:uncharacterized membrane protein YhaH (DUF805 family)
MSFGAAISSFFTKYATFSGRARRSEFWYVVLFTTLVSTVISIVAPGPFMEFNGVMVQQQSMLSNLWSLATLVPSLALTWRRLHDINKSGNYFFFVFLPVVGWIILFIQLVKDSVAGENAYGAPVK